MNFKEELKEKFKEGLLILAKYGLIVALILYSFNFMNQTRSMAENGNNAAVAIREFQEKGWLPAFVRGTIPQKEVEKK